MNLYHRDHMRILWGWEGSIHNSEHIKSPIKHGKGRLGFVCLQMAQQC